jgi:thioredoxin reductase (NADPH)
MPSENLIEDSSMTDGPLDVIIIGGGPAGLTAAIYASRLGMKTRLFERQMFGGRAAEAPEVWNFPGFPEGTGGAELVDRMAQQAWKFGADLLFPVEVLNLKLGDQLKAVATRSGEYYCVGLIVATGTTRRKLLVPGETEFLGRGVSYCAVCDGPLFRNKKVVIVGSGNEAFEDAIYLSGLLSKVLLVTHRNEIEAEKALVDECQAKGNVEIVKARMKSVVGENLVTAVRIANLESGKEETVPVDGVFFSVGGVPMTNLVKEAGIKVDKRGCINVDRRQATNIEGVYAAGDCTCGGMQIITAAGEGAMAAIQAYRHVKIRMK